MSLATITQLVQDKLRTVALGREQADPRVVERAIEQAVLQYGLDSPRHLAAEVANVTGGLIDVPAGWVVERSQLEAVEYPIGVAPMATLEAAVVRSEGDVLQVMLLDDSLSDATVRIHYTAPHVATLAECSVPAEHDNAVACWAVAELCRQLATQRGHDRDATLGAAAVNGQSQSGDLARRAKDWFAQYRVALNLPDPEATTGGQAAGAVVQFDRTRVRGRFSSWGY